MLCCCYYKATRALVGGVEADSRLLELKIEGDKIKSKCYTECQTWKVQVLAMNKRERARHYGAMQRLLSTSDNVQC